MKIRKKILSLLPLRLRFALRYMVQHGRFCLLLRPVRFTEKLALRIACDRRKILRDCADKIAMRNMIADRLGDKYLPSVIAIARDPESINWAALPSRFVLKGSHGSGFVLVVDDFDATDKESIAKLKSTCGCWLEIDYGKKSREWAYCGLEPKIIIEEFISNASYRDECGTPWDFKCFVFNGSCELIQVDHGRFGNHNRNLYARDWSPVESSYHYPRGQGEIPKPQELEQVLHVAEQLGSELDFVRVDLYITDAGILVGELTMTPGGGVESFSDDDMDLFLGRKWQQCLK
jgi:hypothetical protein